MKLHSIEIQGFKSFKDKIKLQFNDSICAIVGPNGSGKSNISDAIRWVLGEQSAKTLRGSKMQDIIFSGTNKFKPLNFAQVSLNFNNYDKWIPVDYNEVTITRRVFRTGESEYYLNKKQCRLKDVKEVFMDTGIGKEGYSIIGQGRIDEILSSKSEDRRFIFEEASGISKFKYKKEESLKKLEKTIANLGRIEDILSQKISQRDYLKEQSEKAEKGLELTNRIKLLDLYFNKLDILKYEDNISRNLEEMSSLKDDVDNYNNKLNYLIPEIDNLQEKSETLKEEYEKLQNQFTEKERRVNELVLEYKLNEEKSKYDESENLRLKEEKEYLLNKIEELNKKQENIKNEKEKLNHKIGNIIKKIEDDIAEKDKLEKNIIENRNYLEGINEEIEEKSTLLNDIEVNKRTKENIEKSELEKLYNNENNRNNLLEDISKLKDELNTLKDKFENSEGVLFDKNKELEDLSKIMDLLDEEARKIIENKTNLEINLKDISREYEFYKNIVENYEGFNRQVTLFFKKIKKSKISHLALGTLADLISVEDRYSKSINAVLSGTLQNIVVNNESDAKILIEFLKREKIGRLTFLPLNKIRGNNRTIEFNDNRIIAVASDIIKCDDQYKSLVNYFLGRTLIVSGIDDAIEISKKFKQFRVVTLDGDIFNSWGSVVGGYNSNRKMTNIINRNKKLDDLIKNIDLTKNRLESIDIELIKLKKEFKLKQSYKEKIINSIKEMEESHEKLDDEIKEVETQIRIKDNSLKEVNELISDFNRSKDLVDETIGVDELKEILLNLKEHRDELEDIIKELSTKINILEHELIKNNAEKDSLDRDLNINNNYFQEYETELEDINNRIIENSNMINEITEIYSDRINRHNSLKEEVEKEKDAAENFDRILPEKKLEYESLLEIYMSKKDEISEIKTILNKLNYNYDLLSNKIDETNNSKKNIIDYIKEEYNIFIEAFSIIEEVDNSSKNELKKLKNELKNLGYFSVDSIEEYKIINEESEFLISQKMDLLKSKDDIGKIIENLDHDMKKLFSESFLEINERFNKIFSILFAGGHASLEIQDKDILNGGIDIVAEPPGKKMQNLSLLSGGERALTAVALLFAIFETKPSPFCVLDEIDAALDEANIFRYTNYLKSFTDTTQFIMISHRKSTMEIADILYGVSMEEEGVSKVISLELE